MKPSLAATAALALGTTLSFLASQSAHAEADASAQITFTSLTISLSSGTVQPETASTGTWSSQVQMNGQPVANSSMLNASAYCTVGSVVSDPYTLNFFGTANAAVDIPGNIMATGNGNGQANVNGSFEITGGTGPVNATFQVADNGTQSVFTDNFGQSALSQTTLSLNVGGNTVISDNRTLNIGSSQSETQPFNTSDQNTISLNFNQVYDFTLSDTAYVMAVNVPEPTTSVLVLGGLVVLGLRRVLRR